MKVILTTVAVITLQVNSVESRCDCKFDHEEHLDTSHLDTKDKCCSYATQHGFQDNCSWNNNEGSIVCAEYIANNPHHYLNNDYFFERTLRQIDYNNDNYDYPPYFERQPTGSVSCAHANYHNILKFAHYAHTIQHFLTDPQIIEIGDALGTFKKGDNDKPYVTYNKNGEITQFSQEILKFLYPLQGLKTKLMDWVQLCRQYRWNDDRIDELFNDPNFIGFTFIVQSSADNNWNHHAAILKDPRPNVDPPQFWQLDPGFPVIEIPARHQKWRKRIGKQCPGIARVGVDGEGKCIKQKNNWCHGNYPYHSNDFETIKRESYGFERWEFQASQKIFKSQLVDKLHEMCARNDGEYLLMAKEIHRITDKQQFIKNIQEEAKKKQKVWRKIPSKYLPDGIIEKLKKNNIYIMNWIYVLVLEFGVMIWLLFCVIISFCIGFIMFSGIGFSKYNKPKRRQLMMGNL